MGKFIDLTGQKFNRLTVISRKGTNKCGNVLWKCKCECGNETVTEGTYLLTGHTKSCGCLLKDSAKYRNKEKTTTHGLTYDRDGKIARLYRIWLGIKTRCFNPNEPGYFRYGGRGIKVCDEWMHNFKTFHDWALDNGYKENLTIDRINNNGNYEPDNCKWATSKEQANNRRTNRRITMKGETKTVAEWAEDSNIKYCQIIARLNDGWSLEKATTIPIKMKKRKREVIINE